MYIELAILLLKFVALAFCSFMATYAMLYGIFNDALLDFLSVSLFVIFWLIIFSNL